MKRPTVDELAVAMSPDTIARNEQLMRQNSLKAGQIPRDRPDPLPKTGQQQVAAKSPRIDAIAATKAMGLSWDPCPDKGPNKTELRFYRDWIITHFAYEKTTIRFQPRRYYLSNGHSYRPDWEVWVPQPGMAIIGSLVSFEVKGPYIHSRDSRILFDTAKHDYPEIEWHWAQWKNGRWNVE